jgi:hypothetical protein
MSCNNQPSTTSLKYKTIVKLDKRQYTKDSIEIYAVLKKMLSAHLNPFIPVKEFDSGTKILVDSIIYSPDKLRIIVFVITKNTVDKLLIKENDSLFFYNANYLYCSRTNKNSPIKIYDYAGFKLVNYYNLKDIKERLRDYCFHENQDEIEENYNLDDVRFWKSKGFDWVIKNSVETQIN